MEDGMTVNELIAELQVLAAQGHGELDVCVEESYEGVPEVELATSIKITEYVARLNDNVFEPVRFGAKACLLIA
jgi:hypothetical protein